MRPFFVALALISVLTGVLVLHPHQAAADTFLTDQDKARLTEEYNKIQAEISTWQKVLDDTRSKKASLQGDVTALNALINKATAEIKQRNVTVTKLADEINQKAQLINDFEEQLRKGRLSLANMLRQQSEADERSLAELILSNDTFATFYGDLEQLAVVRGGLQKLFDEVRTVKETTETEKQALTAKRNQELDAKYDVELAKKQIAKNEAAKKELLNVTKDQEKAYATVLAERQRRADAINSALFPLRDATGISFGTALEAANTASQKTGVRAALILAILSQESDLGKNIGSCYVTDINTGDGVGKNTGTPFRGVMKAPRDTVPFQAITVGVGRSWATTPVSCPIASVGGYGGAMGPTQFIPSTWMLYQNRLMSALNTSGTPDPWDAKTAIMATALYMQDNGAAGGTYSAEWNSACRYYSGAACTKSKSVASYGDSVIKKAEAFQENIDFLKGV